MRHEKVIEREDKRIKICVTVCIGSGNKTPFKTVVEWAEKGKRTWKNVTKDDRAFRTLSTEDQVKTDMKNQLSLVSECELLAAKTEAWEKLKPQG